MICEHCGHDNRPTARFCEACGERVWQEASPLEPAGERRQVTIVFCDLVGSTALAERLDPEDVSSLVRRFHALCTRVVEEHEGYVGQYMGDGVLAYFGYPRATEHDSQSAVRAALKIVEAAGTSAPVRIGIHTGVGVTGAIGGFDRPHGQGIFGIVPNVAARIQALAEPGSVLISETTYRLVHGFFDCEPLGPQEMKGLSSPLRLHRVRGPSGARSRVDAASGTRLTPLVGREHELGELVACWQDAREAGRIALVRGDAGLGKSRLQRELAVRVADDGGTVLEARCSTQTQSSALRPIIDLMERQWGIRAVDPAPTRFTALQAAMAGSGEDLLLLGELLAIPLPDGTAPLALSPQNRKRRTLEAILAQARAIARQRPLLLVVEDLHWIDPSTSELLDLLVEAVPHERMMLLLTFRPEYGPPWPLDDRFRTVDLQRLSSRETALLVEEVAGKGVLPPALVAELGERADGVPLFAEELTKAVVDNGSYGDGAHALVVGDAPIPSTLQESLMARLDRLAPVKELVQVASTLGRSFPHRLLRSVSSLEDTVFTCELERLVEGEILHRNGTGPDATYRFKHVLIQEAAHESLLRSRRAQLHERVACTLREAFPHLVATQPELVAQHYIEAGKPAEAIAWCHRAGALAVERSAHREAQTHLERGLELIEELPPGPERDARECALRNTLGVALLSSHGYAASEVAQTYTLARALCNSERHPRELFTALWGLGTFHQSRAELATALELAEERLALARRIGDEGLLLQAHEAIGTVSFWRGELAAAESHLQLGIIRYDPARFGALALEYGQDVGVVCRSYAGVLAWFRGRPDSAVPLCESAIHLARERRHPYSLGLALDFAAALRALRREPSIALELADEAISLSREQQFPFWLGFGSIMRAWSLSLLDRHAEALAELQEGIAAYRATGAELGGRFCLALLSDVQRRASRIDDAIGALDVALPNLAKNEDLFWDAEITRLRGELFLAREPAEDEVAEQCFGRALRCSRSQSARSLELRAASSLARLWKRQGRRSDAEALLRPLLAAFSEGHHTADLCDARALLDSP